MRFSMKTGGYGMRGKGRTVLLVVLVALLAGVSCRFTGRQREEKPRNIILLIGDGMGVSQLTAGYLEEGGLSEERMPVGGLVRTFPQGGLVTDSAASGTAIATGHKTRNGRISTSADGDTLRTVFEYAEDAGMSTGLVVTCSITHATPAVFAAHVPSRRMETEIARQIAFGGVDVLIGGGWSFFVPRGEEGSGREDDMDLEAVLEKRMPVVRSLPELDAVEGSAAAALLAPRECPPARARDWSLAEMTSAAIDILARAEGGFILMVEGSQIDWAGHEGDYDWLTGELEDFDGAVGAALDFAAKDGGTLVIVTADHETGGLALLEDSGGSAGSIKPSFATNHHTMAMVPLFALGPGSSAFGGIHDNTFIGERLIEYVSGGGRR